jgi:hypothetical protein
MSPWFLPQLLATASAEGGGFFDFVRHSQFRFYQERDLGLDLYHSGLAGIALFTLAIASAVIFLLAIFHVIAERRHAVILLLVLGLATAAVGTARSYVSFGALSSNDATAVETRLVRETAGPAPVTVAQLAAVLNLPLVLGAATLAADALGCVYILLLWGRGRQRQQKDR